MATFPRQAHKRIVIKASFACDSGMVGFTREGVVNESLVLESHVRSRLCLRIGSATVKCDDNPGTATPGPAIQVSGIRTQPAVIRPVEGGRLIDVAPNEFISVRNAVIAAG